MPALILKLHEPSHQRVKRIVLTLPNIHASLMLSPTLPNQNRPRINKLPAKALNTQPLPCESRPFVDDPPPFLCAMTHSLFFLFQSFRAKRPAFFLRTFFVRRAAQGGICFLVSYDFFNSAFNPYNLISLTSTAVKFCRCPREILY